MYNRAPIETKTEKNPGLDGEVLGYIYTISGVGFPILESVIPETIVLEPMSNTIEFDLDYSKEKWFNVFNPIIGIKLNIAESINKNKISFFHNDKDQSLEVHFEILEKFKPKKIKVLNK